MTTLWIALFGAMGVVSRFLIDQQVANWTMTDFPVATFAINCLGSLLIGFLYVASGESGVIPKELATILTVGLLGGFTTFSAFSIQTFHLFERGKYFIAASYLIGSPLLGVCFATGGILLARLIWANQ